jgi:hypothetical protein
MNSTGVAAAMTWPSTRRAPVLRRLVTLVNDGTIGHSIDFHSGALASAAPSVPSAPPSTADSPDRGSPATSE